MTHTPHTPHRLLALSLAASMLLAPASAVAADVTTFELMPACAVEKKAPAAEGTGFGGALPDAEALLTLGSGRDTSTCAPFTIVDPATLKTSTLKEGDTIDLAIVIKNPTKAPVIRAKAWVSYDPKALSASTVTVDDAFPTLAPGENTVSAAEGQVKVNATAKSALKDELIVVARVRFTVLAEKDKTVVSFHDAGSDATKHSVMFQKESDATTETAVTISAPASLVIPLPPAAASSVAPVEEPAAAPVAPAPVAPVPEAASAPATVVQDFKPAAQSSAAVVAPVVPAPATPSTPVIFPNLRIQNLRVTTQGGSAYLGWDALNSVELVSYNIYYGATSGQYLQRKTIDKSELTLTIRGLPENTPYFFAIRGLSASGLETEFSQEVSVVIGKPQTSTSPLSAALIGGPDGQAPKTDGTVSGESGMGSSLAILAIVCAAVGTILAGRRQMIALSVSADHVA